MAACFHVPGVACDNCRTTLQNDKPYVAVVTTGGTYLSGQDFLTALRQVEIERDEARAEVERLNVRLTAAEAEAARGSVSSSPHESVYLTEYVVGLEREVDRLQERISGVVKAHLVAIDTLKALHNDSARGLKTLLIEAHRELTTLDAVTASPTDMDGLASLCKRIEAVIGHRWDNFGDFTACAECGIIRRSDDGNKPCQGRAEIALRKIQQA